MGAPDAKKLAHIAKQLNLTDVLPANWNTEWLEQLDDDTPEELGECLRTMQSHASNASLLQAAAHIECLNKRFVAAINAAADGTVPLTLFADVIPPRALREAPRRVYASLRSLGTALKNAIGKLAAYSTLMQQDDSGNNYTMLNRAQHWLASLTEAMAHVASPNLEMQSNTSVYLEHIAHAERTAVDIYDEWRRLVGDAEYEKTVELDSSIRSATADARIAPPSQAFIYLIKSAAGAHTTFADHIRQSAARSGLERAGALVKLIVFTLWSAIGANFFYIIGTHGFVMWLRDAFQDNRFFLEIANALVQLPTYDQEMDVPFLLWGMPWNQRIPTSTTTFRTSLREPIVVTKYFNLIGDSARWVIETVGFRNAYVLVLVLLVTYALYRSLSSVRNFINDASQAISDQTAAISARVAESTNVVVVNAAPEERPSKQRSKSPSRVVVVRPARTVAVAVVDDSNDREPVAQPRATRAPRTPPRAAPAGAVVLRSRRNL